MLQKFFNPSSIAVIGASHTPGKVGYEIVHDLKEGGFQGKIFPVNPVTNPILGLETFSSIKEIKEKIDLAVIAVPAMLVPKVLEEAVKKKVESIVIVSGGFSETGKEGKILEEKIKRIISRSKSRVIGPNCIGVFDPETKVDTMFLPDERMSRPFKGRTAFITQSGAVGSTILDWLSDEKIGVSKFVSYGNGVDVNESDLLDYLAKDQSTSVICVYLEGIKADGKKFIQSLKSCSKQKPVIILKAGKSSKGTEAVASHTGSLAGSPRIYSAVFKESGVLEAGNWEELFDMAKMFSTQPLPKNNKLLIITNGGGYGVLATDEAEKQKLQLPAPSKSLASILKSKFPNQVTVHNPMDLTGDATSERYKIALEAALKSNEYDGLVVITLFQVPTLGEDIIEILSEMKKFKKPVICVSSGSSYTKRQIKKLEERGIPVYSTPEGAVKAFAASVKYKNFIQKI